MKAELKNAKDFYKLLKFISQWQTEIRMVCNPDKLSIVTMSQCSTVFIDSELPSSYFTLYNCVVDQPIGLNLSVVLEALKHCTPKDKLRISTTEPKLDIDGSILESPDNIMFSIMKPDGDSMTFEIKQMDITMDSLEVPPMDEDVTIKLHPMYLKKWKSVVDFTKASVKFIPSKNVLNVESEDKTIGNVKAIQPIPTGGIEYLQLSDNCGPISVGEKNILKCFSIGDVSNDIQFGYKNELPIRFQASIGDGYVRVYTAPMIGDEMDEDD